MSIKLGDVDPVQEIVELHYQLRRTQKLLEIMANKVPLVGGALNSADIAKADEDAFEFIRKKFPTLGVERKT